MIVLRIFHLIVLPVFLLVGLGFLLDRRFRLDTKTLGVLNFYAFVPALVFLGLVQADLAPAGIGAIGGFCFAHLAVMYLLSRLVYAVHPQLRSRETMLSLGAMFSNAGNYGIPLIVMAFGPGSLGVIAVVMVAQNFLMFTVGVGLLERKRNAARMFAGLVRIPTIHAIALALLVRVTGFDLGLVEPLRRPVQFLADGLIPVALLTLGAQLSRARPGGEMRLPLLAVTTMRLVISPLAAAGLVMLFGFRPPVSSIMVVAAGLPVAVNVAILAGVYRRDEELASQAVFWSTVVSALTVSILLVLVGA